MDLSAIGIGTNFGPIDWCIVIGYLAGELFRLVDGRTMGAALRQDFPGLDLWIGLPEAEHDRVAQMRKPAKATNLGEIDAIVTVIRFSVSSRTMISSGISDPSASSSSVYFVMLLSSASPPV